MWATLAWSVAWATSCELPLAFEEADRATWIAVLDVTSMIEARVVEVWKGAPPVPLVLRPLPDAPLSRGRALVFLGDDGAVHLCDRVLALHAEEHRRIADEVKRLLAVDGAAARAARMVALGTGDDEALAVEALGWLASRPDLLVTVDADQRAALVAYVPRATGKRAYALSWTLARLQEVSSLPLWIQWLDSSRSVNARPIIEAMQVMTHHRAAGYTSGHDVYGADLAAVRGDFQAWWSAWGGKPAEEGWAASNADASLSAMIQRNRCELDAAMDRSALPTAGFLRATPSCP